MLCPSTQSQTRPEHRDDPSRESADDIAQIVIPPPSKLELVSNKQPPTSKTDCDIYTTEAENPQHEGRLTNKLHGNTERQTVPLPMTNTSFGNTKIQNRHA